LGGQAANWDSTVELEQPVVEGEVRVSMEEMKEAVKNHQRTEATGSTSPAVRKIQTPGFVAWRR